MPKSRTADGYIRVSRVGGRTGEGFISPEVQRQRIQGWADANGVEILEWWEELDQSGGRRERPLFQEALARCERGETGGIVVAKLDRFARSAVDALESIKRLNEAGARFVSVEDGFDGSTPMGRFAIGILSLIAELELERIKESWQTAISSAVGRGIHISARVPTGYVRDEKRRLVPVEPAASAIRECFRLRATGASWTSLARYLEQQGVTGPTGTRNWSKQSVTGMLRNRVYLGEARSGMVRNPGAHPAVVTQAEFDAAQAQTTLLPSRDGSLAAKALLGGLVRCAGCGHTLKISGTTNRKTKEREPVYSCVGRYASGLCPARAAARAFTLDDYVEHAVLEALRAEGGPVAEARAASGRLDETQRALEAAEHELELYLTGNLVSVIGEQRFLAGVKSRQQAIDDARQHVVEARSQAALIGELTDGDLLRSWPSLSTQEKRQLLHGLLDRVVLTRAGARGRGAPPISSRCEIVLRGNVLLDATAAS
jgi:DNA invertase Pin-like site-specific DNA recombinase